MLLQVRDQRNGLQCLAEAHFVTKNKGHAFEVHAYHPIEAYHLVVTQRRRDTLGLDVHNGLLFSGGVGFDISFVGSKVGNDFAFNEWLQGIGMEGHEIHPINVVCEQNRDVQDK